MNIDNIIIFSAKAIGLGVVWCLTAFLAYLGYFAWWRVLKNIVGAPVALEAIREYRKTHPERFKTFNAVKDHAPE